MNTSRCPKCDKRLIATMAMTGQTKLVCLKCDDVEPMNTDAVKWGERSLARPARPKSAED